jgi:hypothetical protein
MVEPAHPDSSDSEVSVVTSWLSFGDAHRSMVYVRVFIGVSGRLRYTV